MSTSETHTERGRVLVVDDEPSARSALQQLLQLEGYEVEAAADGRAALLKLSTFEPDVVLTDLKMPGMDGLALVEQGRVEAPHCAFLVMTAFGSVDSAVSAMRLGAENYLTKPLDMGAVTVQVERAIEHARLRRDAVRLREQLGQRLDRCRGAAEERADEVREATEVTDGGFDGFGALSAVLGVLGELAAYGLGAGLRDAGLGHLDLGVGQVEQGSQLREESAGVWSVHAGNPLDALTDCVGARFLHLPDRLPDPSGRHSPAIGVVRSLAAETCSDRDRVLRGFAAGRDDIAMVVTTG